MRERSPIYTATLDEGVRVSRLSILVGYSMPDRKKVSVRIGYDQMEGTVFMHWNHRRDWRIEFGELAPHPRPSSEECPW